MDLTQTNIDPNDPIYQPLLEDLQGNILKSYGRDYSAHIFLKFKSDSNVAKKWIQSFAENYVTSAKKQLEQTMRFKATNCQQSSELFANFFLSSLGYKALGFNLQGQSDIGKFPSWQFIVGLKSSGVKPYLQDPPVDEWEPGFQNKIDALILLADNNCDNLEAGAKKVIEEVGNIADIVNTEVGIILKNKKGQTIEHFGFRDGVSQPLFLKEDIELAKTEGTDKWDSTAPLELVLVKDPLGQGEYSFGSYCVYRKLEQDVRGFREAERELAKTLKLSDQNAEMAGALAVGRFRDGTPVTLFSSEQNPDPVINNFNYDDDIEGTKCPFHAHIRKANPRGDKNDMHRTLEEQRKHRIVRRAISYGEMPDVRDNCLSKVSRFQNQLAHLRDIKVQPAAGEKVGLLFLCFQRDIFDQFMFMQKNWSNHQQFVTYRTGLDALTGQGKKQNQGQMWPTEWGKNAKVQFDFYNFVSMKGGEFFFAPSISFLRNIRS